MSEPITDAVAPPQGLDIQQGLVPMARYSPDSQVQLGDFDTMLPDWREHAGDSDPEIYLLGYLETRHAREIARLFQWPVSMARHSEGIEKAITQIPREVGRHFQAHGIAGKSGSSIEELDVLLRNGIQNDRTFYTTELAYNPEAGGAVGADMPFVEGGFVTVFGKDDQSQSRIEYVIVGENFLEGLDLLRHRYADVTFVPWHDVPQFFTDIVNQADGTAYQIKPIAHPETYNPVVESNELPSAGNVGQATTHISQVQVIPVPGDGHPDIW